MQYQPGYIPLPHATGYAGLLGRRAGSIAAFALAHGALLSASALVRPVALVSRGFDVPVVACLPVPLDALASVTYGVPAVVNSVALDAVSHCAEFSGLAHCLAVAVVVSHCAEFFGFVHCPAVAVAVSYCAEFFGLAHYPAVVAVVVAVAACSADHPAG